MFKDLGIKGRVLLLTLLPTSLLAMVLGGYFTWVQLSDMRAQLIERGQLIAEQLAPLAATALARKDTAVLNRIANEALDQPDVRAVTFLDARQERLAHAGPSMLTVAPAGDASHLSMSTELDTTHFLLPVLGRHHSLSGATEPDDERVLGWVELELSHHGTLLRGYRSLFTSLLLIAAGLGVTALLALRMSRAINAPLELISQGVAQLKEGRMETRLPPMGSNELDELASGINRMAETLQSAQEEMQHNIDQATEDVRQNLETIEIQNIELDLARKEALEASRIKSEFLANMSHEIRTPLNGILGFTNLLQKSELSPRQQDYLTTIQKSAESLLGIINEILDFSKIEAGKLVLENLPFNLRDLIQDALTMLAPAAHEKQLELVSLVYRDTPIQLQGDPQRLKQILTNLVGNAIKFTQGGTVAVRAMLEDESDDRAQLRISVQDTGIGLSEEDQQALFKAFSQADNSLSRQAGGTGLGLVISKRLIEQMGGEIGVDSTPGEGAEFWISLSLPKSRDDNEEPGASWAAGQRVALLEPQELTRRSLHHQLTDFGLEVSEFADLDSLQESLRNPPPGQLPISLAVLGVSAAIHPPEELSQSFWEFERLGCKTLVLCPTTEQAQYHATLPDEQVEAKPACTRKLQRKLQELLQVRPTRSDKPHAMVSGRPPRLLCVDDNPANLLLVQTLLSDLGAQVTAVDSGYAALEVVQRERFDLVFMDVQMPGMDGRQATEAIRRWEAEREVSPVPVIALTAHALSNEKRALLQAGMDDYLTKPIDEQQLAQVVLKWTGLSLGQSLASMSRAPQLGQLSVLDPEEGLRLAAGKADLAADMLAMLLASLAADRQAIRQARDNDDRTALLERVHRLHGATRYCGVPQLRAACQNQRNPAQAERSGGGRGPGRAGQGHRGPGRHCLGHHPPVLHQPRLQRTLTMRILFFSSQAYDSESFQASNHRHGFELHFQQAHLQADTAVLAQGFEVVCAFVNDDLSRPVLERLAAGGTRLVALRSAGYNHVDLAAAEALGLPVVHVPAYSPHAVAEHAVGLILTLNRRLHRAYNRTREGDFSLHGLTGFDLHGKRVGVIGTGQIGETFARIMAGFGCELLAYDPYPNPRIQALGGRYLALDALLAESDIVSLHCPLTADTRHLIDAQRLATMKPGAMLINTGRGALVNAAALIEALKSGQLGYLGLDVYEEEADIFFEDRSDQPLQDDVLARLLSFPNVVVTAHQAFLTREALAAIADTTLDNIAAWQDGTPRNRVRA
ncbi:Sensor histidine kinase RcsC [Pseudomonas aeruginosa]